MPTPTLNQTRRKQQNKIDPAVAFLMSFGIYQLEYGDLIFELSDEHKQALEEFNGLDI